MSEEEDVPRGKRLRHDNHIVIYKYFRPNSWCPTCGLRETSESNPFVHYQAWFDNKGEQTVYRHSCTTCLNIMVESYKKTGYEVDVLMG